MKIRGITAGETKSRQGNITEDADNEKTVRRRHRGRQNVEKVTDDVI